MDSWYVTVPVWMYVFVRGRSFLLRCIGLLLGHGSYGGPSELFVGTLSAYCGKTTNTLHVGAPFVRSK